MHKKTNTRVAFLIAAAVWALSLVVILTTRVDERLENFYLDWNLRLLAAARPPDPQIVMLDIDEATLEAMSAEHGRYPWSRAVFGQLLEGLEKLKPRAIVFDILFIEPHKGHAEDDNYLIRTAQRMPNVYFPMTLLPDNSAEPGAHGFLLKDLPAARPVPGETPDPHARAPMLIPLPGLTGTGRLGTINVGLDNEGNVRRYALRHDIRGWRILSMPARVASDLGYPLPPGDSFALIWHGKAFSYPRLSFHEVFFDLERRQPNLAPGLLRDKIVIIGASAAGLHDLKLTPMGTHFPGPEIIATAIDNLKHGERLRYAPPWSLPLLTAMLLLILATGFSRSLSVLRLGVLAGGLTAVLLVAGWASVRYGRMTFPVVTPILFGAWFYYLLTALRAWMLERSARQQATQMFGRFLDPRVVSGLLESGELDSAMSGQKRDITVLFSDIRGFTALSERRTPQQVVDLLNRYFSLQVEVIFRHQGTLDKYIGDAIMAFWGAPSDQPDHARRALAAARDMEQALLNFKVELGDEGKDFDVGIGLCSGDAVVGAIGAPARRLDYTVIGDTVNTASRIEGATKGRARILVSEATVRAAGEGFRFVDHDWVALKGKEDKVHLFEPIWETTS
ncbi:MAG: hypothetical protein A2V91_04195 [Candidatus Muproteobacteria bacterium RBG_16_64_10]|uniref:Guanylate cyclase domain-containing protein n=1 Tax=Candidatus Muproteobacteria bacterium RBG_16_64_10 TaxID=1817757 RepID=A0A1F6SXK3_9PROT|nr:MAG: hypothetical protein A2V91_04195 [Candidatus Muproteobacteria bacterium RBG_16_64_10]